MDYVVSSKHGIKADYDLSDQQDALPSAKKVFSYSWVSWVFSIY